VSTEKSQNNQIWIFLFKGFNLAHSQPYPHLKFLMGLESWPPSARKVPILTNLEADLKKNTCFFGPETMRDVYLDFRLPWPAKIVAGMLTPCFDHTNLGFPSIESNSFFTKTKIWKKLRILDFFFVVILDSCFTNLHMGIIFEELFAHNLVT
jgi:hypothetical protein